MQGSSYQYHSTTRKPTENVWLEKQLTCISSLSTSCNTHPTDPSPEHTRTLNGAKCLNKRSPSLGPAPLSSNTCAGLRSCLKRRRNFTPWLSPGQRRWKHLFSHVCLALLECFKYSLKSLFRDSIFRVFCMILCNVGPSLNVALKLKRE